ncbi:MAG: MFS transporter [Deferribacteraceae bacterium]|jgi:MFS family permease|nr:MFS transporter [Deferribacteraceae bacterium]
MNEGKSKSVLKRIPGGVWALGFVSMLMDISSEMIHSLLPLFMITTLGATYFIVGIVEGLAEATALIVKVFSGVLSDWLGKRKWVAATGYTLGAFTKPFFAMATSMGVVTAARLIDRVGKGIRGAPRDALITDITPAEVRGAAFGLRQSLDTVGAFIGPLLAFGLMLFWINYPDDTRLRNVFWVAVIPGALAVLLIVLGVKEPAREKKEKRTNPISRENLKKLSSSYWWVVCIGAFFSLARFSEAFLVLRAKECLINIAFVPLVMVVMNIIYSFCSYPFGKLSDKGGHTKILITGLFVLIAADFILAVNAHWAFMLIGVAVWGVHMGMTQGLLSRMIADAAPVELRGTAFGFFNLVSGISMLIASIIAGIMWDKLGWSYTFYTGAGFCLVTIAALALHSMRNKDV